MDHPPPVGIAASNCPGLPRARSVKIGRVPCALPADRCRRPSATNPPRSLTGGACGASRCSSTRCARATNWGIGDFGDLKTLIRWLAAARCGLHRPESPACARAGGPAAGESLQRIEPAFSQRVVHRGARSAGVRECAGGTRARRRSRFADRLRELRDCDARRLSRASPSSSSRFSSCCSAIFASGIWRPEPRARGAFRGFVAAGGPLLQLHARFDALDRYFRTTRGTPPGWLNWPEEFRDVARRRGARFAAEHPLQIEFYLPTCSGWRTNSSRALRRSPVELGMPIGLYGDYAVGAHPSGSETWADQASYRHGRGDRRAARSAGAQGPGLGNSAAGPGASWKRSICRGSYIWCATTCATTARCAWTT